MKAYRSNVRGFFVLVFLVAIVAGNTVPALSAETPNAVSFGTSSVGSAFYTLSVVIANVITKHSGITATVEPVGGSDATVRGLAAKQEDAMSG